MPRKGVPSLITAAMHGKQCIPFVETEYLAVPFGDLQSHATEMAGWDDMVDIVLEKIAAQGVELSKISQDRFADLIEWILLKASFVLLTVSFIAPIKSSIVSSATSLRLKTI